jgi:hypothetical protein
LAKFSKLRKMDKFPHIARRGVGNMIIGKDFLPGGQPGTPTVASTAYSKKDIYGS